MSLKSEKSLRLSVYMPVSNYYDHVYFLFSHQKVFSGSKKIINIWRNLPPRVFYKNPLKNLICFNLLLVTVLQKSFFLCFGSWQYVNEHQSRRYDSIGWISFLVESPADIFCTILCHNLGSHYRQINSS